MKIQSKILLAIILTLIISTVTSILLINLIINVFDKSYTRYDIEKLVSQIVDGLQHIKVADRSSIDKIINNYKTDKIDITLINKTDRNVLYSTIKDFDINKMFFLKRRFEDTKKSDNSMNRYIKFIELSDNRDFVIVRPVIIDNKIEADLFIAIDKDMFPPFSIRINRDKLFFIYILLFVALVLILVFSFIIVLFFTMPLIKRLRILFNKINNFDLTNPNIRINDNYNDEIGTISKTFDRMSDKIREDYNERIKFYEERQELIKNISHDFRTPLTSILGYSVSLDEGFYDNEEEQKKYYSIIRKKAEYMSSLFDELMELSRLDSNAFILKKARFDMAEILREIIIEYIPQLEKDNFTLESDIPESLIINADKDRLSRAIRNIIDNVVKHAAEGKYLGIFLKKDDEKTITLNIMDKGKGIPESDSEKIFKRFYKNSQVQGMGIGLSITREIIKKHNGNITVKSCNDTGSCFIITLPLYI